MAWPDFLPILVIGLYFLGTALYVLGSALRNERLKVCALSLAGVGFVLHAVDLTQLLAGAETPFTPSSGRFLFCLFGFGILCIFLFLWWRLKMRFLAVVALPLALVFYATANATSGIKASLPPMLSGLFFFLRKNEVG